MRSIHTVIALCLLAATSFGQLLNNGNGRLEVGGDNYRFESGAQDFSVEAWIVPQEWAVAFITDMRDANDDGWLMAMYNDGTVVFSLNTIDLFTSATLTSNELSHVCFTVDRDGDITSYVNGIAGNTASASSEAMSTSGDLHIFSSYTDGSEFTGEIQEVRIYDMCLSSSDVMNRFLAGANPAAISGVGRTMPTGIWNGPSYLYESGDNLTLIFRDLSGNDNYGIRQDLDFSGKCEGFYFSPTVKDSRIDCDHVTISGVTNATMMGWIKGSATAGAFIYLSYTGSDYWIVASDNGGKLAMYDGAGWINSSLNEAELIDGTWHHFAFAGNSSENEYYIYIDGILMDTVSGFTYTGTQLGGSSMVWGANIGDGNHIDADMMGVSIINDIVASNDVYSVASAGRTDTATVLSLNPSQFFLMCDDPLRVPNRAPSAPSGTDAFAPESVATNLTLATSTPAPYPTKRNRR